jgi:tRNA(His) 5'-end guanylyltransferase
METPVQKPSLEDRMREREYFHGLWLLPGAWAVVRVDGRNFTRFTAQRFEKPFDPRSTIPKRSAPSSPAGGA